MKKVICVFGMIGFLTVGVIEESNGQVNFPTRQVSARAKGAIIGGGLGAAAGAIIHKRDPITGGIVGAVVGAGAGYVIGNNEDKIRREQVYQRPVGYYGREPQYRQYKQVRRYR